MQKGLAGEGWPGRLLDLVHGCFQAAKGSGSDECIQRTLDILQRSLTLKCCAAMKQK